MDKRGGKSSKVERIKMRKKLLETGGSLESSIEGHIPSENNLKNEKLIKETIVKNKDKLSGKKRKEQNVTGAAVDKVDHPGSHGKDSSKKIKFEGKEEKKKKKLSKKKRNKQIVSGATVSEIDELDSEGEDGSKKLKEGSVATKKSARLQEADVAVNKRTKKSERVGKKKKDRFPSEKDNKLIKEENGSAASDVYHISSVDVDSSKGMKKWVTEYHQSRPGLEILQQRIDEFIISHEEQEEQTRKEKEALAAEGGWTVVVHQKGRKKTTDTESGTTMGSVAQAAVVEKMKNVRKKDVGPDFYRFQKRDAQRNEIMMLQSKFEQDKKRIQQLRAARKFRPY
ncbi:ribosomal RNA-processing 7 protein [Thalictrum thalictroides]|uniref:Ribosomal RNA-processing 7 protein n=1 Tax=Thalictrum thalictroides TaxID=46969 RepID=A0A7J6WI36_THATH|nr:ribosomal RNA-processing 7 protein [Thalictrum thalictroides]